MTQTLDFPDDIRISFDSQADVARVRQHVCKGKKAKSPRVQCPLCDGSGKILEGHRKCPDCQGAGMVSRKKALKSSTALIQKMIRLNGKLPHQPPAPVTKSYDSGWVVPVAPVPAYSNVRWNEENPILTPADTVVKFDDGKAIAVHAVMSGEEVFRDFLHSSDPQIRSAAQDLMIANGAQWR